MDNTFDNIHKKQCSRCKNIKDICDFQNDRSAKSGKHHRCKICNKGIRQSFTPEQQITRKQTSKRWYQENKEHCLIKMRNNWLIRHYKITSAEYEILLLSQNSKCAICKASETGRKKQKHFPVDHDHKTGKIRGLLCDQCNKGLGHFKDDPEIMERAIQYVKRSSLSSNSL